MTIWVDLKEHFAARALEWFNAIYLTLWGAYVILHPGLFYGPTKAVWTGLINLGINQEVWGFCAFVAGSVRVVALFINGRWGLTPIVRVATSFLSVFVWFMVSVGLYRSGISNPSIILYPGLMFADMYSAFRAAGDAYEAEANKRLRQRSEGISDVAPHLRAVS